MQKTRKMVICAMIAALYTALCLANAALSYGMVQIRVAEALTLLPIFSPYMIWGVTLGCAMSNLLGFMLGTNILGFTDVFLGSFATLVAAWMSWKLRSVRLGRLPLASAVPPVLCNAVVIGFSLMWLQVGRWDSGVFLMNAAYVGAGQTAACFGLGIPMALMLEKTGVSRRFLSEENLGSAG